MLEKNEKNEGKKERKKEKRALLKKRVSQNKSLLIWFEYMMKSVGFRVANHFTTDTHNWFAR